VRVPVTKGRLSCIIIQQENHKITQIH